MSAGSGGGQPRLLVWSQGGVWRWTYHEAALNGAGPLRLDGSIAFPDAEEARSAAETAFPGVPVELRVGAAPRRGGPGRGGPTGAAPSLLPDIALAVLIAVVVLVVPDRGRLVRAWAAVAAEAVARLRGVEESTPRGSTRTRRRGEVDHGAA
jgi:hypothetical protein